MAALVRSGDEITATALNGSRDPDLRSWVWAHSQGKPAIVHDAYRMPDPSAPDGSFITLSVTANSDSAGANVLPFNGNVGFAVGDGLVVWGTSRAGAINTTVKGGNVLASNAESCCWTTISEQLWSATPCRLRQRESNPSRSG